MLKRLQQQLAFTNELEKLKATHRNNRTLDAYRFENSAEHSWQGALMALVFRDISLKKSIWKRSCLCY